MRVCSDRQLYSQPRNRVCVFPNALGARSAAQGSWPCRNAPMRRPSRPRGHSLSAYLLTRVSKPSPYFAYTRGSFVRDFVSSPPAKHVEKKGYTLNQSNGRNSSQVLLFCSVLFLSPSLFLIMVFWSPRWRIFDDRSWWPRADGERELRIGRARWERDQRHPSFSERLIGFSFCVRFRRWAAYRPDNLASQMEMAKHARTHGASLSHGAAGETR